MELFSRFREKYRISIVFLEGSDSFWSAKVSKVTDILTAYVPIQSPPPRERNNCLPNTSSLHATSGHKSQSLTVFLNSNKLLTHQINFASSSIELDWNEL